VSCVIPGRAARREPGIQQHWFTPLFWIPDRRFAASGMTQVGFQREFRDVVILGVAHAKRAL
jgi:hypothetical protein